MHQDSKQQDDRAETLPAFNSMVLQRRTFLGTLVALGLPRFTFAQGSLLPLNTPGLDHLDVIVPDVAASARFYMGLFKTALHAQPFQGGSRYFILLGELKEGREVGYIAIGDSRGRGTYIGHFCTSVVEWRRDSAAIFAAMADAFRAAGLGEFPGSTGVGGIFADPDGIEIQFLPAPDTLVTAAVPSDLVTGGQGLVTPLRVNNVLLHVSDIERALAYYRILYGAEQTRNDNSAMFEFTNGSRLLLEQTSYAYGTAQARIARYGIQVEAFDRAAVEKGIVALGGNVVESGTDALRLKDVDGIEFELVTA